MCKLQKVKTDRRLTNRNEWQAVQRADLSPGADH